MREQTGGRESERVREREREGEEAGNREIAREINRRIKYGKETRHTEGYMGARDWISKERYTQIGRERDGLIKRYEDRD